MQLTEKQKSEGWRIVKFGEIAKNISKRVDPNSTDLEVDVCMADYKKNTFTKFRF